LCPEPNININKLAKSITNWLPKNTLIIATTDLVHFGKNYPNSQIKHSIKPPYLLNKIYYEEQLIYALKNLKPIHEYQHMMCGSTNISIFLEIAKNLKWKGEVIDYYDSYSHKSYIINDYFSPDIHSFVSYVSILYMFKGVKSSKQTRKLSKKNPYNINLIDIKIAVKIIQSIIAAQIKKNPTDHFKLPLWSNFHLLKNGVFVANELQSTQNTACCIGRFQNSTNPKESTATKLVEAAKNCLQDSQRWNMKYSLQNLQYFRYKIEILDDQKKWRSISNIELKSNKEIPHSKKGVHLTINDNVQKSATYLPIVAAENHNWTLEEYMGNLSKKAGGKWDSWDSPDSQIKIYKTYVFSL
tara:strand:- start:141 stop:1208 length:1068 start_codon:yes stop_codon:yes gene_type:complete